MSQGTVLNIQKFCIHDGPGIRSVVFLKGCPLSCAWCANPASQNPDPEPGYFSEKCLGCGECAEVCHLKAITMQDGRAVIDRDRCDGCGVCAGACPNSALEMLGTKMNAEQVLAEVEKDTVFYRNSGGGVTLSGGEPLMQPEFAAEILRGCRELGINTAMETAGLAPWKSIEELLPLVDLFLYDLKHPDDASHRDGTGCSNQRIIANLKELVRAGARVLVRTPVIPGFNDSPEVLAGIAEICLSLGKNCTGLELLPYHNLGEHKYALLGRPYGLSGLKAPSKERMRELAEFAAARLQPAGLDCLAVFGTASG